MFTRRRFLLRFGKPRPLFIKTSMQFYVDGSLKMTNLTQLSQDWIFIKTVALSKWYFTHIHLLSDSFNFANFLHLSRIENAPYKKTVLFTNKRTFVTKIHSNPHFTTIRLFALFTFRNYRQSCSCSIHYKTDGDWKYAVSWSVAQSDCTHTLER
jgi:hypothetical protein